MQVEKGRFYAVVTGDVVGSSRLPVDRRRELPDLLRRAAVEVQNHFGDLVPLDVAIYRGDAWQLLVSVPAEALRVALRFRAGLRAASGEPGCDTRLAIGLGGVDFVPEGRVAEGDGEAYRQSGRALEELRSPEQMAVAARGPAPTLTCLTALVSLVDRLAVRWSARQAQAVAGALQGWTQERTAASFRDDPISQQAVAQHLERAGWHGLRRALDHFAATVEALATGQPS